MLSARRRASQFVRYLAAAKRNRRAGIEAIKAHVMLFGGFQAASAHIRSKSYAGWREK